jgi:hypothetical protein
MSEPAKATLAVALPDNRGYLELPAAADPESLD